MLHNEVSKSEGTKCFITIHTIAVSGPSLSFDKKSLTLKF
ncbi:hypothetical protein SAMN02746093_01088 [Legionella quinlivanii DSM 21216]|nr:hypothetical protein SAMN02746093_01088 [Legionella quinlivanii DSM 21216]STY12379.1 Uncharacterised protein [Legionella quinlivanii]